MCERQSGTAAAATNARRERVVSRRDAVQFCTGQGGSAAGPANRRLVSLKRELGRRLSYKSCVRGREIACCVTPTKKRKSDSVEKPALFPCRRAIIAGQDGSATE